MCCLVWQLSSRQGAGEMQPAKIGFASEIRRGVFQEEETRCLFREARETILWRLTETRTEIWTEICSIVWWLGKCEENFLSKQLVADGSERVHMPFESTYVVESSVA